MNHSRNLIKTLGIAIAIGSTAPMLSALVAAPVLSQAPVRVQVDSDKLFNRGVQKLQQQDYQGAISDFGVLIEREPQNANAYLGRAIAYRNQQNYTKALEDYNQSLRFNPTNANAYLGRGIAKRRTQDERGAIEDYSTALRYDENYGQAYYNRALSKERVGDREGALADLRKAAEIYRNQELSQYYQEALARIEELSRSAPPTKAS